MFLSKKPLFGLASLCLLFSLLTVTPAIAQNTNLVERVSTSVDQGDGNLAKRDNDHIGTTVIVETILRVGLKHPKPNLHIASVKVFQLKNGEMVMDAEGCLETTCEYDIAHLPPGLYRVKVKTNHANKGFGKTVYIK